MLDVSAVQLGCQRRVEHLVPLAMFRGDDAAERSKNDYYWVGSVYSKSEPTSTRASRTSIAGTQPQSDDKLRSRRA